MAGGGGNNQRFQNWTDPSGQEILYLRALQGHSGRKSIDPSLQDNVLISNNFFEYIYHTNSGLIPGRQNSSRDRQTVFFTTVNPNHKNHQGPKELDMKTWKRHQDTVYWGSIYSLFSGKG